MKLSSYITPANVRMHRMSLWELDKKIAKERIHATFETMSDALLNDQIEIDATLKSFLETRNSLPDRLIAIENVDATWNIHFPAKYKIAFNFLHDDVTLEGIELMDFDDGGIFEGIMIEVYIFSPTSKKFS